MIWGSNNTSTKWVRQLAMFGAIIHIFLGMSCIILIILYHSIFWVFYLAASALNYAANILLLHGVKNRNERNILIWIAYNLVQIILCALFFCAMCYRYFNIHGVLDINSLFPPKFDEKSVNSVLIHKVKTGTLLDAAASLIFIFVMSPCCNVVIHYYDQIKQENKNKRCTKGNKYMSKIDYQQKEKTAASQDTFPEIDDD